MFQRWRLLRFAIVRDRFRRNLATFNLESVTFKSLKIVAKGTNVNVAGFLDPPLHCNKFALWPSKSGRLAGKRGKAKSLYQLII